MSLPTEEELSAIAALKRHDGRHHDDEAYHSEFDKVLERKLDQLDPDWMAAMRDEYKASGMGRYCA